MKRNWPDYLRQLFGLTSIGSLLAASTTVPVSAAIPTDATSAVSGPSPEPLTFDRPYQNSGVERYAGHSSHASHASHSSHYSGSGGGYPSDSGGGYSTPPYVALPAPPPPPPRAAVPAVPALSPGQEERVMVMRVQARLHEFGYYAGVIDGVLGSKTKDALKRYQLVKGLSETGVMDDATLTSLGIRY